jgi:small redox-active disulfide protein 2
MVKLRVLGMGCQKCQVLSERTEQAARDLGLDYRLDKVTDVEEIARFGVMSTPALVIDDVVQVAGRVPTVAALREVLAAHVTSKATITRE